MVNDLDKFADKLIIGIDLGTTKSGASVWDKKLGKVVMIKDEQGHELIPSMVGWDRDRQEWVVGHEAKALLENRPSDVVYSIKRYIGRWFSDPKVLHTHQNLTYKLVSGGGADQLRDVVVDFGDSPNSPPRQQAPEISAKILCRLRQNAALSLGLPLDEIKYAVITVPAYFNVLQRRATILAGEIAGLKVLDILNEPTAAALCYEADILGDQDKRILIYDLGGGTFDISLLEASLDEEGYEFFTRIIDGDTRLGGDDIDAGIAAWIEAEINKRYGHSIRPEDQITRSRLRLAAEKAKISLTTEERVAVDLPSLDVGSRSPFDVHLELTRADLLECASKVIDRAHQITDNAINDIAGLQWGDIDEVILVGGQSLMPAVQQDVSRMAGFNPRLGDRPQHAVALGAGKYAHILSLGQERFHENALINVIALPLGIREDVNTFAQLVDANVTVPHTSRPYYATTMEDNQQSIQVEVLQGPRGVKTADECVLLGSLNMDVLPAPARTLKFEIMLDVRSDGTMKVVVTDKRTNQSQTKDIIETHTAQRGK